MFLLCCATRYRLQMMTLLDILIFKDELVPPLLMGGGFSKQFFSVKEKKISLDSNGSAHFLTPAPPQTWQVL